MKSLLAAASAITLGLAAPALAQTVAITGGTVALGDGSAPIEGGTVVIRNGRIVAAGQGIAIPALAQTVAITGGTVALGDGSAPIRAEPSSSGAGASSPPDRGSRFPPTPSGSMRPASG